ELAEQGGVGIRLPGFAPQRVLYLGRLERCVAALACEQSQHRHLIVLMRRHPEDRAVRAVGHEPLVHLGRRERYRDPPRRVGGPAERVTVATVNLMAAMSTSAATAAPDAPSVAGLGEPWNHGLKRFKCSGIVNSKP